MRSFAPFRADGAYAAVDGRRLGMGSRPGLERYGIERARAGTRVQVDWGW